MSEIRPAVLFLGTALILCVLAIAVLAFAGKTVPDVLSNLAVGDLGVLAAVLRPGDALTRPGSRQAPLEDPTLP